MEGVPEDVSSPTAITTENYDELVLKTLTLFAREYTETRDKENMPPYGIHINRG